MPYSTLSSIVLRGYTNFTISAYGVTIIKNGLDPSSTAVWELDNCTNVTIEGGTLTQDIPSSYQGRIVGKGTNSSGSYLDWMIDTGYPVPPNGTPSAEINIVDSSTRQYVIGLGDYRPSSFTNIGNNTIQVDLGGYSVDPIQTNDFIVELAVASYKVHLARSVNCTIKDITMSRNGSAPVYEEGLGGGGNNFYNCVWTPGATPPGATDSPCVAAPTR